MTIRARRASMRLAARARTTSDRASWMASASSSRGKAWTAVEGWSCKPKLPFALLRGSWGARRVLLWK